MRRSVHLLIVSFFLLGFVVFVGESSGPIFATHNPDRFVINVGGKYGFIDGQGSVVVAPQYSSVRDFSEGLAVVVRDGKWGFIDTTGKEAIPLIFASASDFSEGVAIVDTGNSGDRAAFVDHRGKLTSLSCVPYSDDVFGFSGMFSEGLLPVRLDNHAVYIDRTCKSLIKTQGSRGSTFSEGLAAISSEDGQYGYIDRSGELVITYHFLTADQFSEGLALVNLGGKHGYINRAGQLVIPPQFGAGSRSFHEGLAAVEVASRMGYVNRSGKFVIQPHYENAGDYSEGLAPVQLPPKGKDNSRGLEWRYIDQSGRQRLKSHFTSADPFVAGRAQVIIHGATACIDRTGRVVWKSNAGQSK